MIETVKNNINEIIKTCQKMQVESLYLFGSGARENDTVIDAVERRMGIIGEALWKALKNDSSISVTDQKKIIRLRHIIVHDYDLIDKPTLWRILQIIFPYLNRKLKI